VRPKTHLNHP
jgi:glycogen debranching enzyme